MNCKDCGCELTDRNKDRWTQKFLDSELCLGCYRIMESEVDPESTAKLDIEGYKKEREIRRRENKSRIIHRDCIKELKKLSEGSIDLILTDPPYNIGVNYGKNKDRMSEEEYFKWCLKWVKECSRVLKENGSLYIINYPEKNAHIMNSIRQKTDLLFRNWIVWHYPTNTGHSPKNFTKSQRSILFYTKGNKFKFNLKEGEVVDDVLNFNLVKNTSKEKQKDFPNQIPLKLLELIIGISSNEGDLVLDPFVGSGSLPIACLNLNRRYVGIEKEKKNYIICEKRIKKWGDENAR